jgi:hypothetical protein
MSRLTYLLATTLLTAPVAAQPIIEFLFNEAGDTAVNTGTLGASGNGVLANILRPAENQPLGGGSSIQLNGANSFVRVQNVFNHGNQLTVEAWIKPSATNGQRVIWDDYGNPGVLMTVLNGAIQFNVSTTTHPGGGISVVAGPVSTNVWQHVAGTYDGEFLRVFINGQESETKVATTGNVIENAAAPAIGSDNVTTTALNYAGLIDDFRIHLQALPYEQLAAGAFAKLAIAKSGNEAILQWRTNNIAYRLESTTNLTASAWQTVTTQSYIVGQNLTVTNTFEAHPNYYRLTFP